MNSLHTPPPLAEAVQALTQQDPESVTRELCRGLESIWCAEFAGHPRLARFRREFAMVRALEKVAAERERRVPTGAALIVFLVLAGAGLSLFGSDMSSRLLWLRTATSSLLSRKSPHAADKVASANHAPVPKHQASLGLRPLPRANADGIVLLDKGLYEAGNLPTSAICRSGDRAIRPLLSSSTTNLLNSSVASFTWSESFFGGLRRLLATCRVRSLPSDRRNFSWNGAPFRMRDAATPPPLSGPR